MQTERLYFANPYLGTFEAEIVDRSAQRGQPAVALDRSAFYPEGGGQPADTGTLNGVAVLDVQAIEGVIWHALEHQIDAEHVVGVLDWGRRLDHMQQHHGQHLLSAAFEQISQLHTVSFHLGADASTIDLATPNLSAEQLQAAEDLCNQVIWADRPVEARFVTAEELLTLPLRKAPVVAGPVRIVSVADFDYSACGGTHPRSTAGVGLLHIRRWERRGATARVEFVCGGRALRDLRIKHGILSRVASTLSMGIEQVEEAVERLRSSEEAVRKQLALAQEQLIETEARSLLGSADEIAGLPVVLRSFTDRSVEQVRLLAKSIATAGGVALLGLRSDKAQIFFARAEGLPVDCGRLVRTALAAVGGRGGGQPAQAQGGVPEPQALEQVLETARQALAASDDSA